MLKKIKWQIKGSLTVLTSAVRDIIGPGGVQLTSDLFCTNQSVAAHTGKGNDVINSIFLTSHLQIVCVLRNFTSDLCNKVFMFYLIQSYSFETPKTWTDFDCVVVYQSPAQQFLRVNSAFLYHMAKFC